MLRLLYQNKRDSRPFVYFLTGQQRLKMHVNPALNFEVLGKIDGGSLVIV